MRLEPTKNSIPSLKTNKKKEQALDRPLLVAYAGLWPAG
jgi:hypothetical protein